MGKEMINGAKIVLECLQREGVTDIFGYPGGAIIPIYDELYKFEGKIKHYLARHEQGAAHEADGYARATGKVGVCMATSGPGATNLVTGIMTAKMDSIPLVAITGQVGRSLFGKDSFQETDITSITLPITKTNYQVMDIKDLPRVIKEAFYIAKNGRPGPVLIDIPKDIQTESITVEEFESLYSEEIEKDDFNRNIDANEIARAIESIKNSKRPLIITGAGTLHSNATKELYEFAKKGDIPVVVTLLGMGSFPGDDELFIGMLGMHGHAASNFAVKNADLIIAAGFRFDDRITGKTDEFCPNTPIIHIDIDPSEISKNIKVNIPIVGDLKRVLGEINKDLDKKNVEHKQWLKQIAEWKEEYKLTPPSREDDKISPQMVIKKVDEIFDGNGILVTDVGQHQMWTAQYATIKTPRTFITSGGSGTMGYGLPASIGAKVACPDKNVVLISGDGGFQMNIQELMLIREYNIPVKILIINNSYLGMVRQWQELFYDKRYSYVNLDCNPEFTEVAKAYGIKSATIKTVDDLDKLEEYLLSDEAILINCVVTREENVFPMIPAGKSIDSMMGLKGVKDDE